MKAAIQREKLPIQIGIPRKRKKSSQTKDKQKIFPLLLHKQEHRDITNAAKLLGISAATLIKLSVEKALNDLPTLLAIAATVHASSSVNSQLRKIRSISELKQELHEMEMYPLKVDTRKQRRLRRGRRMMVARNTADYHLGLITEAINGKGLRRVRAIVEDKLSVKAELARSRVGRVVRSELSPARQTPQI